MATVQAELLDGGGDVSVVVDGRGSGRDVTVDALPEADARLVRASLLLLLLGDHG